MGEKLDPFDTGNDAEPPTNGSVSGALQPGSSSPLASRSSARGAFSKGTVALAMSVEVYQWVWGHAFDRAPWWGAPLALCLTMLPFGVWERLGQQAISVVAEKLPGGRK